MQYCDDCRRKHFDWVPRANIYILGYCELCRRKNVPIFGLHSELAIRRYHNYLAGGRKSVFEVDARWHRVGEKFRKRIRTKRKKLK